MCIAIGAAEQSADQGKVTQQRNLADALRIFILHKATQQQGLSQIQGRLGGDFCVLYLRQGLVWLSGAP